MCEGAPLRAHSSAHQSEESWTKPSVTPTSTNSVRFGSALYGPQRLDFFLAADIEKLGELAPGRSCAGANPGGQEGWERKIVRSSILRADAIEAALTEAIPGVKPRIAANRTGPSIPQAQALALKAKSSGCSCPTTRWVELRTFFRWELPLFLLKKWLETRTERPVPISDGVAVIEATIALESDSGIKDLTLAFVSNVPPREFDYVGPRDANVVGLPAKDELQDSLLDLWRRGAHTTRGTSLS